MFYQVDSRRVTLREYLWCTPRVQWPLLPLIILLKWLRVRVPLPGVVPDSLAPYLAARDGLPEAVRAKLEPVEMQLAACGFIDPAYHWIVDPYRSSRVCAATFRDPQGTTLARVMYQQSQSKPAKVTCAFITAFRGGGYFVSSSARREVLSPPACHVQRAVGASASDLWRMHQQQLSLEAFSKTVVTVYSQEEMLELAQQYEEAGLAYHVQRGVLTPCDPQTQQAAEVVRGTPGDESDQEFTAVYQEIERLADQKASWTSGILTLIVTVALFFSLGVSKGDWKAMVLLGGVLFFHELGHLITMWLFHYRNLKMFFIPFLGAAVSGRNYNVPGWKKAIVSLMGPLPGIVLGIVLGVVGVWHHWPAVVETSLMLLGINAFNLLPILPMDGGQFMHAVLFSRHPVFDVLFRGAAALILIASGLIGMKWLMYLGIAMLVSLPMTYRLGKVVRRLRKSGTRAVSHDSQTVPVEVARRIHQEMAQVLPKKATAKTSAQLMLRAFETLNADPPGWLASLNLIGIYGFTFCVAVVFACGLLLVHHTKLDPVKMFALAHQPTHLVRASEVQSWQGAEARVPGQPQVHTLMATLPSAREAAALYRDLTSQLPACATATLFGQTVLVTLPSGANALRNAWFDKLSQRSQKVHVQSGEASSFLRVSLMCGVASGKEGAGLESELKSYLNMPASMKLVPPWSPEHKISQSEQKARRTYCELQEPVRTATNAYRTPRFAALQKKITEARRRGDTKLQKSLLKQQRQLIREIQKDQTQKHLRQLRQEGEAKWDLGLIDLLETTPRPNRDFDRPSEDAEGAEGEGAAAKARQSWADLSKEIKAWEAKMAPRFRQLPMQGGVPLPGAERFSTRWGSAFLAGPLLRIDAAFEQPAVGLPALAQWLSRRGCFDLKYDCGGESGDEEP